MTAAVYRSTHSIRKFEAFHRACRAVRRPGLDGTLFTFALAVALGTRFWALDRFPIYFFTDEAIQSGSAEYFVHHGLRNTLGELLPTYFQNDAYLNLGVSVYAQVPAYLLFGLSVYATRGTDVLIAVSGIAAVALIMRDVFRARLWWAAALVLSSTPAWFLHSRTAFEPVVAVAMYAWFLYFYLRARTSDARFLWIAVLFAALAFYSYNATQVVLVITALLLVACDSRYFWRHRRVAAAAVAFTLIAALPQARFYLQHRGEVGHHLRLLNSVWTQNISTGEKVRHFADEYRNGLSPRYWFVPDDPRDLERHRMQGWGNALPFLFPFALLGLIVCVWRVRAPPYRTVLIAAACAPLGGAMSQTLITRELAGVVPLTLMTTIGLGAAATPLLSRVRLLPVALTLFGSLAAVNLVLAYDAVTNGPTWYRNYGLYGMQYGGRQLAHALHAELAANPATDLNVTSTWANGADRIIRFFLPNEPRIKFATVAAYQLDRLPLGPNQLFVMTPDEYRTAVRDRRFEAIRVARVIPYPDGRPGFYFVHLRYSPAADAIFTAERRARRRPISSRVTIDGQPLTVRHPLFDIGRIEDVFDGDSFTVARTLEANPAVLRLTFRRPRAIRAVEVLVARMRLDLQVRAFPAKDGGPIVRGTTRAPLEETPSMTLDLGRTVVAKALVIRVRDADAKGREHIHLYEVALR